MRVTNNMITSTTKVNINRTKELVDKRNTQMSTQKKISVPSEDPVVAVRSLEFSSTLSQLNQYLNSNVEDAQSWLDITETSLTSLQKIVSDIRTQCTDGSTGTLSATDRSSILSNLQQLRDEIYSEGDAEYSGRTIFTGYKTNSTLTFKDDDSKTSYNITEPLSYQSIEDKNYYTGTFSSMSSLPSGSANTVNQVSASRIRLSYDKVNYNATDSGIDISYKNGTDTINVKYNNGTSAFSATKTDASGTTSSIALPTEFASMTFSTSTTSALSAANYSVGTNAMVLNTDTGELMLGTGVASALKSDKASVGLTYDKTGFAKGDLKPENYFNCTNTTDAANPVNYKSYDSNGNRIYESIDYAVGNNQSLTVNTQAMDVYNSSIGRDVDELTDSVQSAIDAQKTVDSINSMMSSSEYSSTEDQAKLKEWLTSANKQLDYANTNMQNLYGNKLTTFQGYQANINLAITTVGTKGERLDLIKNRLESQITTVTKLQSTNEDLNVSDVVIDYTAAYNAYNAALQAASKVGKQTLLDYL